MPDSAQTAQLKRQAAERAVEFVQSGMVVGLGVGSTATFALRRMAELLQQGGLRDVVGVPCSLETEGEARQLGIPLTTLEEHPVVDLTIDGADEVDPELNLIKGGGGALLREKIVAQASLREIIVVTEDKLSPSLGTRWPVPVEVLPFGWRSQATYLESLGARVAVRPHPSSPSPDENSRQERGLGGEAPYVTDQGNYILDSHFGPIPRPDVLAARLEGRAGIVGHGLFIELATDVIVAGPGGVRHLQRGDLVG